MDADTRAVVPATVAITGSDGKVVTDHPSYQAGFRSNGQFEKELPEGETSIVVTRGFDYLPVRRKFSLRAGERRTEEFLLRRRSPLRREGWYVGDNHAHMIHGERNTLVDFAYVALAGRAEGLDYLGVAQAWNLERVTPEELERATRAVSTPDFTLTWNLEAPKNYYGGDAARCLGHGWTVGMRGRTADGRDAVAELLELSAHDYESEKPPTANFESHALIHSLGGIVSYTHPARWWRGAWGGKGGYPAQRDQFISNMAVELPLDTVCGPTYDSIDILMPTHEARANAEALKLWFLLLNKGYHMAASASSDATFDNPGRGIPGKVRIYTRLDGGPEMARIAAAIQAGRSFVTSGPLLELTVGRNGSGDVVALPADAQKARVRAWADVLTRVELIRNGTVVRTFAVGPAQREFTAEFDIRETERAWYVARCFGKDASEVAITNPVWFEQKGWKAPAPARARIVASVVDAASGTALDGSIEILRMVGKEAVVERMAAVSRGKATLETAGTARLRVSVPGYRPLTRSVFLDSPELLEFVTRMRPEQLTDWATFEKIRKLLGAVKLEFRMERAARRD